MVTESLKMYNLTSQQASFLPFIVHIQYVHVLGGMAEMCDGNKEMGSKKWSRKKSIKKRRADETEEETRSVAAAVHEDVGGEHERVDILMESIIHVKWVTRWVSYFHAKRHKVPSTSLSESSAGSCSAICSFWANLTNKETLDRR